MSSKVAKGKEPVPYQALLDENKALQEEVKSLKARLEEADELRRAISEGDLDALVIPGPKGEMVFTLDSADQAYRVLVETMNEGTATLAFDNTILYCNRRFAELLNMPQQAIIGTSIYRFIAPENKSSFNALLKHKMGMVEVNLQAEGDISLPVYMSISSFQAKGSPSAWCLVVTDLTEQKKNEEILANERLARSIIEQAAETIVVCDTSGRITHFSNAMSKLCGCDPTFQRFEDLMDIRFSEGTDAGERILPVSFALKGSTILGVEAVFEPEKSQKLHLLLNSGPLKNDNGEIIGCVVTLTDITKRKRAEEALQESEERFRTMANAIPQLAWIAKADGYVYWYNERWYAYTGTTPEQMEGWGWQSVHDPAVLPKVLEQWKASIATGQMFDMEFPLRGADGIFRSFLTRVLPLKDEKGQVLQWFGTNTDIAERKKAEEKIKILANAVESSNDAIITKSLDGIITSWNKGAEQIYGYSAEEILGKNISILEPPTLVGETEELVELTKQEDRIHHYETLGLRKDGTIINVSLSLSLVYDASGQLTAILVIVRDITKSKKAEEELRKSEERYRIVTEQTGQLVYDYDLRTHKNKWAGAIEEVTGYNREEFLKLDKNFWIENILHPDMNCVYKNFQDMEKIECRFKEELKLRRKNGTYADIENSGIYLTDHYEQPYRIIGVLKDITEIKEAEAKLKETLDNLENLVKERTAELEKAYHSLKESERGLTEAQEIAHIGNWERNFAINKLYWSDEMYRIFGFKPQEFEVTYGLFLNYVHPDDRYYTDNAFKGSLNGKPINIDFRIILANGEERTAHTKGEVVFDEKNNPLRIRGTTQDITERIKAEEVLAKIEIARKQEIHHRIKNNLQVISSLLDLQAEMFRDQECIKDSEVLKAFKESQNRVISMALIHEELYKGGGFEKLNFSPYIEELAESLLQTYSIGNIDISLKMDLVKNAFFDMDIAVPLGIIVNELVSNSFKHAFPGRNKGEIHIKLQRVESEDFCSTFILAVSDDGVGIPEDLEIEDLDSLGMQLVTTLVDQLDGELELQRNNGTEFTVRFTIAEKDNQASAPPHN